VDASFCEEDAPKLSFPLTTRSHYSSDTTFFESCQDFSVLIIIRAMHFSHILFCPTQTFLNSPSTFRGRFHCDVIYRTVQVLGSICRQEVRRYDVFCEARKYNTPLNPC
jgi:hypothetical protein